MSDAERDGRTAGQWQRAIVAYLTYMSGSAWRRAEDRYHPEHEWYVNGIRTVNRIGRLAPPSPRLSVVPTPKPEEVFAGASRAWLADELLVAQPRYTDRRLLMRLSRAKLARLLVAALDGERKERSA